MKINHVLAGLWGLAMVAGAVIAISETASARVACDDGQAQWVTIDVPDTDPQQTVDINRKHVFCGDVSGGRAIGIRLPSIPETRT